MGAFFHMVAVAQSVEYRIVIPVVAGSIPVSHPFYTGLASVAELVDALDLGSSVLGVGVRVPSLAYHTFRGCSSTGGARPSQG